MTPARRFLITLSASALLLMPAAGYAVAQDSEGYTAVITQDELEIRAGAGRAYYVVGVLESGQQVEVIDVLFEESWYQIAVPAGVYSYVSKAFVNAQGDGSVGTVNADYTECRAASLRGPGPSYRVQHMFNVGDRVEIVAEEGNYYKILPPEEAYVFIPAGSLRRATAQDRAAQPDDNDAPAAGDTEPQGGTDEAVNDDTATDAADDPADTTDDAADSADAADATADASDDMTDEPEVVVLPGDIVNDDPLLPELPDVDVVDGEGGRVNPDIADTDVATADDAADDTADDAADATDTETAQAPALPALPDVEVTTPARSDELKAMEMALLPYFSTPIENRPLDHMETEYRALLEAGDLPRVDEQIVAIRLRTISRQREILAAMDRAQTARESAAPTVELPVVEPQPRLRVDYEAIGTLEVSSVYDGQSLPRMYRLVDPSGRTVAYVAPTPMIDESDLLNTLVGVIGSSTYDSALKLRIITPEQLDALSAHE